MEHCPYSGGHESRDCPNIVWATYASSAEVQVSRRCGVAPTAGQKLCQVRPSHVTDMGHLLARSSDIYGFFNMPNGHMLQHLD